jgi:hypothetical protein
LSKLLTDLMEAERKRRQLAISPHGKDEPAKAGIAASDADEALRARIDAEHLAAAEKQAREAQAEQASAGLALVSRLVVGRKAACRPRA